MKCSTENFSGQKRNFKTMNFKRLESMENDSIFFY